MGPLWTLLMGPFQLGILYDKNEFYSIAAEKKDELKIVGFRSQEIKCHAFARLESCILESETSLFC